VFHHQISMVVSLITISYKALWILTGKTLNSSSYIWKSVSTSAHATSTKVTRGLCPYKFTGIIGTQKAAWSHTHHGALGAPLCVYLSCVCSRFPVNEYPKRHLRVVLTVVVRPPWLSAAHGSYAPPPLSSHSSFFWRYCM